MDSPSVINVEVSVTLRGSVPRKEKEKEKARQRMEKENQKGKERTRDKDKVALCAGRVKRLGTDHQSVP